MGMILRIASSRIVGQGDIVGRSGYFSLNLSANSVMRGRLDARRTLKSLVADLRFDKNGWLKIGLSGNQINMSESYINTGSLYMCATIFLALGLPAEDSFWTETYMEWTNMKAWKGIDVGADKALRKG